MFYIMLVVVLEPSLQYISLILCFIYHYYYIITMQLDGTMIGDNGFDPLGISETIPNLNYVRAAELKHSRVAM